MSLESHSHDRIRTEAAVWFTAIRTDELSPADRHLFASWLEASPLHVQEYLGVAEAWGMVLSAQAWPTDSADDLINAARATSNVVMLPSALMADEKTKRATRFARPVVAAVAAFVAIALLGTISVVFKDTITAHLYQQRYATTRGEQRAIVLEDGSVIELNTMSSVAVDFNDRQRRIKLVDGEAFFRVAHDPSRPFYVATPIATVRAVGTEFNVYSRGEKLQVAVVDGRVQVAPDGAVAGSPAGAGLVTDAISLGANESIEMHARGPLIRNEHHTPASATAWLQRRLVFDNQRLDEVIAEFNLYTPRQMQVVDPDLAALRISGTFDADEPGTLVTYLEQVQKVAVMRRDGMLYFTRDAGPQ